MDYNTGASMVRVPTVKALKALPEACRIPGGSVWVEGYEEAGDAGAKLVYWSPACRTPDNGGTVHAPADGGEGRWQVRHDGVGRFSWFGHFDADRAADDALDAMVNDPAIRRIEAGSDLRFVKRHQFGRSRIELDFGGFSVYTEGMEDAPDNDPFAALLLFRGHLTGAEQTIRLTEPLAEMDERFPVADTEAFTAGDWWIVRCDRLSGGAERELEKMLRVTEVLDDGRVRFDYKNGWRLEAGREISYRKVEPVVGASVRRMKFHGAGTTMAEGSHPVAYEFAAECHVSDIDAYRTFWPVIMRRYCSHYVTERCKLTNPVEVLIGGTGYLTQQIYCLYGVVRDCLTSNGRHLNDFTGSAYGYVENCHADGDDLGAFVTHGQYEHDLTYVGNSGLMSFANSGPTWGESAKRITVKQHVGSWFIAHRKVTDLTLEDVHVFKRDGVENSSNTGSFWLNADGVQMKNCTAEAMVRFVQVSDRSARPNVAENCSFTITKGRRLSHEGVEGKLQFVRCRFHGLDGNRFEGKGELSFRDCQWQGTSEQSDTMTLASSSFSFVGGSMDNTGVKVVGAGAKRIEVAGGARLNGTNAVKAFLIREAPGGEQGTTEWRLTGYASRASDSETAHVQLIGPSHAYVANGVTFEGGRFHCPDDAFEGGGYMLHKDNIELNVSREVMPAERSGVQHADHNMNITTGGY
ncbi:peptidase C14 [Paenibacillus sp. 1011MAR3C5]|uniref:peptidase C14 n=1 Tax=Paenibacillus sp. 1011MAR3C5 TaxID=1675787 RepID=UPI000E6BA153|nr:peptidase C14 [Paenibacillus sp. 1011MAR3C5]RJE89782.1 peptidase C14 [Paenibacillus sp. 1011MAR3C5]